MYLNLSGLSSQAMMLLQQGKRIRGTLGYAADGSLNFSAWNISETEPRVFTRLRHGRISVGKRHIHMHWVMDRREKLNPVLGLNADVQEALSFIHKETEHDGDTKE